MEIDEVARMLDLVESGEAMEGRQKRYNEHTKKRDLAILTLFLGTGIRVSELVGIDIDDVDFNINAFTVTRNGRQPGDSVFSGRSSRRAEGLSGGTPAAGSPARV